ncbi:undecaprenyl-diphosphatase [Paenibacillus sp. BSR1-1]|uniref:undecaprenyl-diphosphatase n=1 Tax=Paenibacillus sp. BSR1-1 TaxID=3020845 RepID=UPI0025AF179D|nr:undecaprenyl-diphosphatase [Paenibacillus sp. BSR1-1]MDN3015731.1 undecaprenyl-diphosphatase [Paenibacillus sp. BSR1-1]
MNYEIFQAINQNAGHQPLWDGLMVFFTQFAFPVFALVLLLMWFLGKEKDKYTVVYAAITAVIGLVINFVLGHIFYENRPFVTHHVNLLVQHAKDSSFPSDHATGTFSIALTILWRKHRKIGIGMLLFAICTGISRVYVGNHYPFDVLASIIVSLVVSGLVFALQSVFEPIGRAIITFYNRIPLVPKNEHSISK